MNLAAHIDHTILKAETTEAEVLRICGEAAEWGFAAVCVPPFYVKTAKAELAGTAVRTATVSGFPFGYSALSAKLAEIEQAVADGAGELDMVINIAALKSGFWRSVEAEARACAAAAREAGRTLKVIVESGILTAEELERCIDIYAQLPIGFMKTSTGYAAAGATVEAVQTMRRLLPGNIRIKASGGIRTFEAAKAMIAAGADRLGCSASVQIMQQAAAAGTDY